MNLNPLSPLQNLPIFSLFMMSDKKSLNDDSQYSNVVISRKKSGTSATIVKKGKNERKSCVYSTEWNTLRRERAMQQLCSPTEVCASAVKNLYCKSFKDSKKKKIMSNLSPLFFTSLLCSATI